MNEGKHFFAITTQQDSFEQLRPSKILGLAECNNKPLEYYIRFIQTKPDYMCQKSKEVNNCIDFISNFLRD